MEIPARSDVAIDVPVFTPPFIGSRVAKGISLDEIATYINETALFRNQWQYRPQGGQSDDEFKASIRPQLRAALRSRLIASPLLDCAGFTRKLEAHCRRAWAAWCDRQSGA